MEHITLPEQHEYNAVERETLLNIARDSIKSGIANGVKLIPELNNYAAHLQEHRATFVTLKINGNLRGCIGSLLARQPLVADVAENAFNAAFCDPRFQPLSQDEFNNLDIHISVLTAPEKIEFTNEAELIAKIRPNIDGLILHDGKHQGTFLPSVWEDLPDRNLFWQQLKHKAGLPSNYWSRSLEVFRYSSEYI